MYEPIICSIATDATGTSGAGVPSPCRLATFRPVNAQTGTSYTPVIGDLGGLVTLANAAAITLTVPPSTSVGFPVGATIDLAQLGAGLVTVAAGSGVTVSSLGGVLAFSGQYAAARLTKLAAEVWLLAGDLTAPA